MINYSNNTRSKLIPLIISIFIFSALIVIGFYNFFTINNNVFKIILNILGLIVNTLMVILSIVSFSKLKRKLKSIN